MQQGKLEARPERTLSINVIFLLLLLMEKWVFPSEKL